MSALSSSAPTARFHSGRYLHDLLGGSHGEMEEPDDPYLVFKAQVVARMVDCREAAGVSADDLGRQLGVRGGTVSMWEMNPHRFPLKHVGRLAKALEVPWQQLLGLAPIPVRHTDPLEELSNTVAGLMVAMQDGTAEVTERLTAIERRLPPSTGQVRPKRGGKPASHGEA